MTANELADDLVWIAKNRGDSISRQLADIVRQQQTEIEALKQIIDANNLNQNIGQFVKTANEPVAYVNSMCNDYIDWKADPMSIDGQPLYNHPVNVTYELTMEKCRQQQVEIEALKRHRNRLETLAEQMLQGDGNE